MLFLLAIAQEAEQQGVVYGDLVSGAVEFHDREVREVMTPRPRIVGLPVSATVEEALRRISESGHTRFPLYRESLDDVVGFVYARDLYEAARRGRAVELSAVARPAMVVPWSKRATALLTEMRTARVHMAVVVNEHGSTIGLVTMEDLLEVIVGEIHDEHRLPPAEPVRVLPGGSLEAEGAVPVRELNDDHGTDLPESEDYLTVAGLVLERLGAIPRGGDVVQVAPHTITVLEMDGHRIARVRIDGDGEPRSPGAG